MACGAGDQRFNSSFRQKFFKWYFIYMRKWTNYPRCNTWSLANGRRQKLSSFLAYFPRKVLAQLAKIFSQSDDVQKFWQFSMCFLIGPKIVTWVWSVRDSHCRRLPAVPAVSGGSGNLAERQRRVWSIFGGCCFPPSPDVAAVTGEMLQVSKSVNAGFADGQSCERSERDFVVWRRFLQTYQ